MDTKKIGRQLSLFHRYKHIYISHQFSQFGIGAGQYMFLLHINEHEGLSQKELSQSLRIDKGTTTKAIKKLIEQGLITCSCSCYDKRQHEVYVTEKGKEILPKLEQIINDFYSQLCQGLSHEDLEIYMNISTTMEKNLCRAVESIKKEKCCYED